MNILVSWFMVDTPPRPILLYTGSAYKGSVLEEAQKGYEMSQKIATQQNVHRTIHVGTYTAYLSLLGACLSASGA